MNVSTGYKLLQEQYKLDPKQDIYMIEHCMENASIGQTPMIRTYKLDQTLKECCTWLLNSILASEGSNKLLIKSKSAIGEAHEIKLISSTSANGQRRVNIDLV